MIMISLLTKYHVSMFKSEAKCKFHEATVLFFYTVQELP
jgi:hypothetical protein